MAYLKLNKNVAKQKQVGTYIVFVIVSLLLLSIVGCQNNYSSIEKPDASKLSLTLANNEQPLPNNLISVQIKDKDGAVLFFVNGEQVAQELIENKLLESVNSLGDDVGLILSADKSVVIENIVFVMDIANKHKLKMVLATEPKK